MLWFQQVWDLNFLHYHTTSLRLYLDGCEVYKLCINLLRHHPMIAFTSVMRPIYLIHFS